MTKDFKVNFHARGFVPGKDISDEEWTQVISEFVEMNNQYSNSFNSIVDQVNTIWNKYEVISSCGNDVVARELQKVMGISEDTTYYDWVEKNMLDVAKAIDAMAEMSDLKIRSNIFRDGELPIYGVKLVNHPEWTVDFTLELDEE